MPVRRAAAQKGIAAIAPLEAAFSEVAAVDREIMSIGGSPSSGPLSAGFDINPVVREEIEHLDIGAYRREG
jgi:hypothetical protein